MAKEENGKPADKVAFIPIGKIRINEVRLRDCDKEDPDYCCLAESVKKRGVLTPISVREYEQATDPNDPKSPKETLYGLIDGTQRYNAALDAGLTTIAAKITHMDQAEIEEVQIEANAQKVETKPIQYANAIDRLLQRRPTMTIHELASRLSRQPAWLYKVLGMAKRLNDEIKPLVDDKKIVLSNAVELSKLPKEEQPMWLDKAMQSEPGQFVANVAARIKEIKEARSAGRKEAPPVWAPTPNGRKWSEVKSEYMNDCKNVIAMIRREKITDPIEAARATIAWCARMDKDSQDEQRKANEERKVKDTAERERRKAEREKQKEEEARQTKLDVEKKVAERTLQPA